MSNEEKEMSSFFMKIMQEEINKKISKQDKGKLIQAKIYNGLDSIENNLRRLGLYECVKNAFEAEYGVNRFNEFIKNQEEMINQLFTGKQIKNGDGEKIQQDTKSFPNSEQQLSGEGSFTNHFQIQAEKFILEKFGKQIKLSYATITEIRIIDIIQVDNKPEIKRCLFTFKYPNGREEVIPLYVDIEFRLDNDLNKEILANILSTQQRLYYIVYNGNSYIGTPIKETSKIKYGVGKNVKVKENVKYSCIYEEKLKEQIKHIQDAEMREIQIVDDTGVKILKFRKVIECSLGEKETIRLYCTINSY